MKKNVLRGEMAKYGLTVADMAKELGVSHATMSNKLNGKTDFTLTEAKQIVRFFNSKGENHTLESMFFAPETIAANK